MHFKFPTFALLGFIVLILGIVIGYFIYRPGYGAGPQGVTDMLFGIGIAVFGCTASLICGIVSLFKGERPFPIGFIVIIAPVGLVIL